MRVLGRLLGCSGGMLGANASPHCYSLNTWRTGVGVGGRPKQASREGRSTPPPPEWWDLPVQLSYHCFQSGTEMETW